MTELERTAQQLLDMWDIGWIRSVSVVNTTGVTKAFVELRDALSKEEVKRLNQEQA